jgi:hypothetical protein
MIPDLKNENNKLLIGLIASVDPNADVRSVSTFFDVYPQIEAELYGLVRAVAGRKGTRVEHLLFTIAIYRAVQTMLDALDPKPDHIISLIPTTPEFSPESLN